MNKKLLMICFYANVFMFAVLILIVPAAIFKFTAYLDFVFQNPTFLTIRMILTIPILILWITNLRIWSREDKGIKTFLLLFFLNALYNPFYFRRALKNNWI